MYYDRYVTDDTVWRYGAAVLRLNLSPFAMAGLFYVLSSASAFSVFSGWNGFLFERTPLRSVGWLCLFRLHVDPPEAT